MRAILTTIHGSHLYGLSHPGSDRDTYEVFIDGDKSHARQNKSGDDDTLRIHLSRFQQQVADGVPQALEALYSPVAIVDPTWTPMLVSLRPNINETRARYRRTILNFAFKLGGRTGAAREHADQVKLRRHAVRLTINLRQLTEAGTFRPRLSADEIRTVHQLAGLKDEEFTAELIALLEAAEGWPRGASHTAD